MILDSIYPSEGGGGAESQVGTLTQWLASQGVSSTIVVPMVPYGPQRAREVDGQVEIIRLRYPRLPMVGGVVLMMRLAWLLFSRRKQIQAIHCHIAKNMAVAATLVNRLIRKPMLTKLTGLTEKIGGILDTDASRATRIKRQILLGSDVQAISHAIASKLRAVGFADRQIHYIPNGVDLQRFDPANPAFEAHRRQALEEQQLLVVFVGRLETVKGLNLLIDAWVRAFDASDPVRLLLIGSGTLEQELLERIDMLQRNHQIELRGRSNHVARYLAAADLGVLPSQTEGLSNTLLESMAMGLPMIGSRISGNEDFIQPFVTGWLFPPGDTEALADCLRTAWRLNREQLAAMGSNAREYVEANASIPVIGERLMGIYGIKRPEPAVPGDEQGRH